MHIIIRMHAIMLLNFLIWFMCSCASSEESDNKPAVLSKAVSCVNQAVWDQSSQTLTVNSGCFNKNKESPQFRIWWAWKPAEEDLLDCDLPHIFPQGVTSPWGECKVHGTMQVLHSINKNMIIQRIGSLSFESESLDLEFEAQSGFSDVNFFAFQTVAKSPDRLVGICELPTTSLNTNSQGQYVLTSQFRAWFEEVLVFPKLIVPSYVQLLISGSDAIVIKVTTNL